MCAEIDRVTSRNFFMKIGNLKLKSCFEKEEKEKFEDNIFAIGQYRILFLKFKIWIALICVSKIDTLSWLIQGLYSLLPTVLFLLCLFEKNIRKHHLYTWLSFIQIFLFFSKILLCSITGLEVYILIFIVVTCHFQNINKWKENDNK